MQILFGPEHDHLQIDPSVSGAYEWWYFDALSDEGNYALVVIYFLGSPMSPYYKAVVDGRKPDARDWCGVFVALHEKRANRWAERAYAYNLYHDGMFATDRVGATIGSSRLTGEAIAENVFRWQLSLHEPRLWRGGVRADLTFIAPHLSSSSLLPVTGVPGKHAWVCVAPDCRVAGQITPTGAETAIQFSGTGYHDHNFGILPWDGIESWYWARARFSGPEGDALTGVCYDVEHTDGSAQTATLLWRGATLLQQENGNATRRTLTGNTRNAYGLRHFTTLRTINEAANFVCETDFRVTKGLLAEGPFYQRVPVAMSIQQNQLVATSHGIGEIFQPARLCGPIAARAMWTRMRRR